ncbi:MAG: RnfABCDGE type electron transport complex subunit D [Victivallales bacterium]|nr:RnfABCDGE type electron transport complex subunit D [Victivallales bacterium]
MSETQVKLPDTNKLVISSSPHIHEPNSSVPRIMKLVLLALLPASLASIWVFGLRALWLILVTTVSAVAIEALCNRVMKQKLTIGDCSAAVTGLLLALNLPPMVPTWVCIVGAAFAIILGKMVYGGLGYNPFNPALVGRIVLLLALPTIMTHWTKPVVPKTPTYVASAKLEENASDAAKTAQAEVKKEAEDKKQGGFLQHFTWTREADAKTQATPLAIQKQAPVQGVNKGYVVTSATPNKPFIQTNYTCMDLFLGNIPGSIGETSKLAILIGGLFLLVLGLIRWQVPVFYIGTVAVISAIAHAVSPEAYSPALVEILSGGLFFGAFFMATDMVTSPLTKTGAIIFAIGCGVINSVIRLWGSYPEGVTFSILLMNALTPLIDKCTAGRPFGALPHKKEAK